MGAGVHDAFPPPMCCVDCLRVSFGRIARRRLVSLGRIVRGCITKFGRGGACVPARVALQGRIHRSSPRIIRVFLAWRRRYADVRAGTQAPPLRFRLGGLYVGRLVSFGWIARGCPPPICVYSFVHLFTHENVVSPCKSAFGNKSYV